MPGNFLGVWMEYSSEKKKGKKSKHKDPFPQGRRMNVFMEELEETMLYLIDYGGHLSGKAENIRSKSIQIT